MVVAALDALVVHNASAVVAMIVMTDFIRMMITGKCLVQQQRSSRRQRQRRLGVRRKYGFHRADECRCALLFH